MGSTRTRLPYMYFKFLETYGRFHLRRQGPHAHIIRVDLALPLIVEELERCNTLYWQASVYAGSRVGQDDYGRPWLLQIQGGDAALTMVHTAAAATPTPRQHATWLVDAGHMTKQPSTIFRNDNHICFIHLLFQCSCIVTSYDVIRHNTKGSRYCR